MKSVVSFALNAFMGLAFGMMFAFPDSLHAEYVTQGGSLYERYAVQETYYYCGRPYVRSVWKYRPVTNYKAKDWRETALNVINAEKERQAFSAFVANIGATNLMGGYHAASAVAYPSATGSVLGGFSSLEYSRYGSTTAFDVNRASELAQLGLDAFTRTSADNALRADAITQQVGVLQKLNVERVGAIAEIQETRAAMREMSAVTKEIFAGQAEVLRALRPPSSETFRAQSGAVAASQEAGQASTEAHAATATQMGLVAQYCGKCHGATNPDGGLTLTGEIQLTAADFGGAALRLAPDAPPQTSTGKPLRMPPADAPQPNIDERREIVNAIRAMVRVE